jgi:hypothetical protein
MTTSTPGYDLRTKGGRYNLRTAFKHRAFAKPSLTKVLRHTLAPIWCSIVGHDKYDAGCPPVGDGYDLACRRCQKFINPPGSCY